MANWEKLDKELDEVLTKMSLEDWKDWDSKREAIKVAREMDLLLKSKLFSAKMNAEKYREEISIPQMNIRVLMSIKLITTLRSEDSFAMAA